MKTLLQVQTRIKQWIDDVDQRTEELEHSLTVGLDHMTRLWFFGSQLSSSLNSHDYSLSVNKAYSKRNECILFPSFSDLFYSATGVVLKK